MSSSSNNNQQPQQKQPQLNQQEQQQNQKQKHFHIDSSQELSPSPITLKQELNDEQELGLDSRIYYTSPISPSFPHSQQSQNTTNMNTNTDNYDNEKKNEKSVYKVKSDLYMKRQQSIDTFAFSQSIPSWLQFISNMMTKRSIWTADDSLNYYKHLMTIASTYEQWYAAAYELDRLEGNEEWKNINESEEYDYDLIANRMKQLRKSREENDFGTMIYLLRTSLSREIGDICNPSLYSKTRVGTKRLIEEYIEECIRHLNILSTPTPTSTNTQTLNPTLNPSNQSPLPTLDAKLDFFLNLRQNFGRTALLLSGGATLGMNHIGVIKALHESKLLPRIISGSSVGSLIAALVCSKTDIELDHFLRNDEILDLNAYESKDEEGSLFYKLSRFIKHGILFDVEILKECVRKQIGDITFQDAYNRTRRVLNISVSSSTQFEMQPLLNYLTTPHVLIWSAVCASCAIPFVYQSAPLMCRDKYGLVKEWSLCGRWIDGSVGYDLPMVRLGEILGVNCFIVCQVNPHVVPFLDKSLYKGSGGSRVGSTVGSMVSKGIGLVKSEIVHRLNQIIELELFPTTVFHHLRNILQQRYSGDITILPDVSFSDYLKLISNPTKEDLWQAVGKGEKATWPMIGWIRNKCRIELFIDECIYRLRCLRLERMFMSVGLGGVISGSSGSKGLTHSLSQLSRSRDIVTTSTATGTTREGDKSSDKEGGNLIISSTGSLGYELSNGEIVMSEQTPILMGEGDGYFDLSSSFTIHHGTTHTYNPSSTMTGMTSSSMTGMSGMTGTGGSSSSDREGKPRRVKSAIKLTDALKSIRRLSSTSTSTSAASGSNMTRNVSNTTTGTSNTTGTGSTTNTTGSGSTTNNGNGIGNGNGNGSGNGIGSGSHNGSGSGSGSRTDREKKKVRSTPVSPVTHPWQSLVMTPITGSTAGSTPAASSSDTVEKRK